MPGRFLEWVDEGGIPYALARSRVDQVLKAQDAQAAQMEVGGRHPRSCVRDVTAAVVVAERAIAGASAVTHEPAAWLDRVLELLADAHERWRMEEDDEDGYGSATLHEIRMDIRAIREGDGRG